MAEYICEVMYSGKSGSTPLVNSTYRPNHLGYDRHQNGHRVRLVTGIYRDLVLVMVREHNDKCDVSQNEYDM